MLFLQKIDTALCSEFFSPDGQSLAALSAARPVFLVFLRHFGCTFCREMVSDLADRRGEIAARGPQLAFVHMGTEDKARDFMQGYNLADVPRFGDPAARLYKSFGLSRIPIRQFFNSETILRMIFAIVDGHFGFFPAGDIQQMPGVFLIENGEIQKSFRHKLISDRPDYLSLATVS
ncbi:MAG TPA: SelL-related redox protein [Candidatus Saccharimonadales bacterium]|nr:SelL-related redox protein [Candidatus Saccharimonadales bacterium]